MTIKINIDREPISKGLEFYQYDTLTLEPEILTVSGCNAAGKTQLISMIYNDLESRKETLPTNRLFGIMNHSFIGDKSSFEGKSILLSRWNGYSILRNCDDDRIVEDDIYDGLARMSRSCGEYLLYTFSAVDKNVRTIVDKMKELEVAISNFELVLLIDGFDDGASIPMIAFLKFALRKMFNAYKFKNIYVVMTANTYETARNTHCINVITGKNIDASTYDTYRAHVFDTYQYVLMRQQKQEQLRHPDE